MQNYQVALRDHLSELRGRLLIIVAGFLAFSGIGYIFSKPITHYLVTPLGQPVYFNTPQGGFEFFMRIIMTVGFIGAVPILIYQILKFVEPAISKAFRKKFLRKMFFASIILTLCGVAFGYFIVLPTTLHFFSGFDRNSIHALISANEYLTLVLGILATFAFIFQLPLIISIVDHIKPLTPQQLGKYRRHVFVGSLILAVILPFTYDPISQFILALPIIALYEVSVIVIRLSHRQTRDQKKQQRIAELVEAMRQADAKEQPVTITAPSPLQKAVDNMAEESTPEKVTPVVQLPYTRQVIAHRAPAVTRPAVEHPQISAHVIDLRAINNKQN